MYENEFVYHRGEKRALYCEPAIDGVEITICYEDDDIDIVLPTADAIDLANYILVNASPKGSLDVP